jgi:hypothetical protein
LRPDIAVGRQAIGTTASMKPGQRAAHIQACMPPIELPTITRRCFTPRPSVNRRCCALTMSS